MLSGCFAGDSKARVNFALNTMFSSIRHEHNDLKERHLALQEELKSTHEQFVEQCETAGNLREEIDRLFEWAHASASSKRTKKGK